MALLGDTSDKYQAFLFDTRLFVHNFAAKFLVTIRMIELGNAILTENIWSDISQDFLQISPSSSNWQHESFLRRDWFKKFEVLFALKPHKHRAIACIRCKSFFLSKLIAQQGYLYFRQYSFITHTQVSQPISGKMPKVVFGAFSKRFQKKPKGSFETDFEGKTTHSSYLFLFFVNKWWHIAFFNK